MEGCFPECVIAATSYVTHGPVCLSLPAPWPSEPLILNRTILCETGEV